MTTDTIIQTTYLIQRKLGNGDWQDLERDVSKENIENRFIILKSLGNNKELRIIRLEWTIEKYWMK